MTTAHQLGVFLTLVSLLAFQQVGAQTHEPVLATSKTSFEHQVKQAKRNRYIRIITSDVHRIGYGNRCAAQATHRMGFEYVPMPIGEIEEKSRLYYFMHNQSSRLKIAFKNGPFWQYKLKRYVRECRRTTGDFTGW
jgi:hypothetical protein